MIGTYGVISILIKAARENNAKINTTNVHHT